MREIFPIQRTIEQIDIADIKIDVRSRDDIPLILLGLQHIYCTEDLREKVFEIIKEMLPTQDVGGKITPVSAEKGCPGMNHVVAILDMAWICDKYIVSLLAYAINWDGSIAVRTMAHASMI